jgi:hypothetical protein
MSPFRRVNDADAGPTALGILVPPSRRTFLILRPRSLSFDLLLLRQPDDTRFRELSRDEATAAAHRLYRALLEWAAGGEESVEVVVANADDGSNWLRVQVGSLFLIACGRVAGKPYQPLLFDDADAAQDAVDRLTEILCPPAGAEQELYFNTRHFQS